MATVSIIVPCYNQANYIAETLLSVKQQQFEDWECIIMDDGSTDNSYLAVEPFCTSDTRFVYYKQVNSGVSAARNHAIDISKGKYILPLDADDLIAPSYIEKAVQVLENNPDIKLVYSLADKFGCETGLWHLTEYTFDQLLWNNMIFCSALYRRSDFDKTSGYNDNMACGCEDWDFWLSLLQPNDTVYRINEVLFHYRIKRVSRTTESKRRQDLIYKQIVNNHLNLYQEYIDRLIPIKNELYWEKVKKESYYRHSLARVKDIILSLIEKK